MQTERKLELSIGNDGTTSFHIDVSNSSGTVLNDCLFFLSTGSLNTTLQESVLTSLGYELSQDGSAVVPIIRVGVYDFHNTTVFVGEANNLGTDILRWLDFTVKRSENVFITDLVSNLKQIVAKGLNPRIKLAVNSLVKSSRHNNEEKWFTINKIDQLYPNSWVLLWGRNVADDFGGEVLWHSETEIPETIQDNTFLYCNKSIAEQQVIIVNYDATMFCRGYIYPDDNYKAKIRDLESTLKSKTINRFYYDVVSRQGKAFYKVVLDAPEETAVPIGPVLSQDQIDALLRKYNL